MTEPLHRLLESVYVDGIRLANLDPSLSIDGGKANFLVKAIRHLSRLSSDRGEISKTLEERLNIPITEILPFRYFDDFVSGLDDAAIAEIQKAEAGLAYDYGIIRNGFLSAPLPHSLYSKIGEILRHRTGPLVVRSNSKLEDSEDAAFAGKYTTVFAGNSGDYKRRGQQLENAIREVFASTYNDNAIVYRKGHNLLDGKQEKMAVIIQDAVGKEYVIDGKRYFLPLVAGVFDSVNHNFRWAPNLKPEDGFGRIVMGFGTQAVGVDVNPRMYSPTDLESNPAVRTNNTRILDIYGRSQRYVDAIDLDSGELVTLDVNKLIQGNQNHFDGSERLISLISRFDTDFRSFIKPGIWWNFKDDYGCLTFDEFLKSEIVPRGLNFMQMQVELSRHLETAIGHHVDSEFAFVDGIYYLLQSRPLTQRKEFQPGYLPDYATNDPKDYLLFRVKKLVPSREIKGIRYVIYVDGEAYYKLNVATNLRMQVTNLIGSVDTMLGNDEPHLLIGPSKLGTEDASLGIPIRYLHFRNSPAIVEYSFVNGETRLPEPSYGSHLFRDLIEFGITFVPLNKDQENYSFLRDDIMRMGDDQDPLNKQGLKGVVYVLDIQKLFGTRATLALDGKTELGGLYLERKDGFRNLPQLKQ